jgi:hypothetical protein
MAEMQLTKTRFRAGIWEGVLRADAVRPQIEVWHQEQCLPGLEISEMPGASGQWAVRLPLPAALLNEGVQTFLFRAAGSDDTLAQFTIITGVALADDIRAEVDLLRAELDMLKRAFRRHCVETAS